MSAAFDATRAASLAGAETLFEPMPGVAYFNTASIGPRLKAVTAAGHAGVDRLAAPWTIGNDDWFEGQEHLRTRLAGTVGCPADCVAQVPSASYGLAVAAANVELPAGSNVVLLERQYPSNVYIWQRRAAECAAAIRFAPKTREVALTDAVLDRIDARTALVAVPNVHWTDGERLDLVAVAAAARQVGAALVVDASQSLGAMPFDFAAVRPDFLVAVGYKWLLGPYGLGYLYVDPRHHDGRPLEETWINRAGSEDLARLVEYTDAYRPGARRFEFGESAQFVSNPMAQAAVSRVAAWGVASIHAALSRTCAGIRERAIELGFDTLPPERAGGHMLGLEMPPGGAERAEAALRGSGVHVGVRGTKLRIAPHLHTRPEHVDRLLSALATIARGR